MRWLGTYLLLLTMTAYAFGLPVRMHEAEHERAAQACRGWDMLPIARVTHGMPPVDPCKTPGKEPCAMCAHLQGIIAAEDPPIVLQDAGARVESIVPVEASQRGQQVAGSAACRGPPARA